MLSVSYPELLGAYQYIYQLCTCMELKPSTPTTPTIMVCILSENFLELTVSRVIKIQLGLRLAFQPGPDLFKNIALKHFCYIFGHPYQFSSRKICLGTTLIISKLLQYYIFIKNKIYIKGYQNPNKNV